MIVTTNRTLRVIVDESHELSMLEVFNELTNKCGKKLFNKTINCEIGWDILGITIIKFIDEHTFDVTEECFDFDNFSHFISSGILSTKGWYYGCVID